MTSSTITREIEGLTSSFDVKKVLEEAKNCPGESQDVNYLGHGEKDNCDFHLFKRMKTI